MKVYIGPYINWIGPYQIAEKILFWMDRHKDDRVHDFGTWLDKNIPGLTDFCHWLYSKIDRKVKVRIDRYDTWSMDHTLAYIILPMLIQLRDESNSFGWVYDEDVPDELKSFNAPEVKYEGEYDDNAESRWKYVLNEMIFSFQCKLDDNWDDQFWSGKDFGMVFEETEDPNLNQVKFTGDRTCDWDGRKIMQDRISNGFRLFGKYYEALWD